MSLFFSAWQLVVRRSLANWRLLSCIIVGVLIAVALLSSTPLYSNALNDLGLAHTLREKPIELLDVHIYARTEQINPEGYSRSQETIDHRVSQNIEELVRQEERHIKSQTFLAAWTDRPTPTGAAQPKGIFQVFTNLEKHKRVEWESVTGDKQWIGTKIIFNIEPKKDSINLRFSHINWKEQTDLFADCNYHWGLYMKSLKTYIETGKGNPHLYKP